MRRPLVNLAAGLTWAVGLWLLVAVVITAGPPWSLLLALACLVAGGAWLLWAGSR